MSGCWVADPVTLSSFQVTGEANTYRGQHLQRPTPHIVVQGAVVLYALIASHDAATYS